MFSPDEHPVFFARVPGTRIQWLTNFCSFLSPQPYVIMHVASRGRGGIGRHTILRGWRGNPCGFKSHRPHSLSIYPENPCAARVLLFSPLVRRLISERLIFVFIHFESNLRAICEQQKKFMISSSEFRAFRLLLPANFQPNESRGRV